jgi:uncharacterized membrane protein YhaH (DUF805 family)
MNERRPGLLLLAVIIWIAYFICAIIFGHSIWFVKILSLASVALFGILVFIVWKNKESKNELGDKLQQSGAIVE